MEMDEEYIDNVKNLIEQKDAENVKALLIDLHPTTDYCPNCAKTNVPP